MRFIVMIKGNFFYDGLFCLWVTGLGLGLSCGLSVRV